MFQSIFKILQKRADSFSFKEEILAVQVCDYFKKEIETLFGPKVLLSISSCAFKDGVLMVKSANFVFSQELQYQKEKIISSLNRSLKKDIVKRIVFKF